MTPPRRPGWRSALGGALAKRRRRWEGRSRRKGFGETYGQTHYKLGRGHGTRACSSSFVQYPLPCTHDAALSRKHVCESPKNRGRSRTDAWSRSRALHHEYGRRGVCTCGTLATTHSLRTPTCTSQATPHQEAEIVATIDGPRYAEHQCPDAPAWQALAYAVRFCCISGKSNTILRNMFSALANRSGRAL